MSVSRLIGLLLLPTLLISSHAQLKSLDPVFEALNRHGSVPRSFLTDVFAGRDVDRNIHTAPFFLDLGATLALSHLSPVLAHTTAFTSLHLNQTAAGEFSTPIQSISNIQAQSGVSVAEFWVEQAIQPAIRLRAGKIDANREFAFVENGANFLNAAAGYTPAFVTLPNYNESRLGAELLLRSRKFHVNLAGFSPIQGTGVLLIEEVGADWSPDGWSGRISGGYWGITGTMSTSWRWEPFRRNAEHMLSPNRNSGMSGTTRRQGSNRSLRTCNWDGQPTSSVRCHDTQRSECFGTYPCTSETQTLQGFPVPEDDHSVMRPYPITPE